MNKKIRNLIIYAILLLIIFATTFMPWFGKDILWDQKKNKTVPFGGIFFDSPSSVDNLKISRGYNEDDSVYTYKISFNYSGADSSMRILGKLSEHTFFGSDVAPSKSIVTLKGDFDSINNIIFDEKLNNGNLHKNLPEYKFSSTSEMRVPLSEDIKDYGFNLSYRPKSLIYKNNSKLSQLSAFVTNARVDKFTDDTYANDAEIYSFNEGGMYVSLVEEYDQSQISRINIFRNINNVLFVLSAIITLFVIWSDRLNSPLYKIIPMLVSVVRFYGFFNVGLSLLAAILILPILGFITVLLGKIMNKDSISFNKYDFSQSLLGAISMFVIGLIFFVIPLAI